MYKLSRPVSISRFFELKEDREYRMSKINVYDKLQFMTGRRGTAVV